jgi:hypothetical protein
LRPGRAELLDVKKALLVVLGVMFGFYLLLFAVTHNAFSDNGGDGSCDGGYWGSGQC